MKTLRNRGRKGFDLAGGSPTPWQPPEVGSAEANEACNAESLYRVGGLDPRIVISQYGSISAISHTLRESAG